MYLASSPQDEMGKPYSLEPFLGAGGLPRSLARVLGQVRGRAAGRADKFLIDIIKFAHAFVSSLVSSTCLP